MKLTDKDIADALDEDFEDDIAPLNQKQSKVDLTQTKVSNRIARLRHGVDEKRDNNRTYRK